MRDLIDTVRIVRITTVGEIAATLVVGFGVVGALVQMGGIV